jgi:hypothetical protein
MAAIMEKTATMDRAQTNSGRTLFLLAMMAQLQLWDGIMTQAFVANGLARESNRLAAHMLSQGNYLPLKIAGIVICATLLWFIGKRFPALTALTASIVCIFYLAVIAWNFLVLFLG